MNRQTKILPVVLLAAFLGGGISPLAKIALQEFPQLSFMALRFLLASLIFLPFVYKTLPKTIAEWLTVIKTTIFAAVNAVMFIYGIKLTGATVSQLIYSLGTVTVATISYFVLHERLSFKQKVGIFIGLSGTVITILLPVISQGRNFNIGILGGNLMIFIGMISYAVYTVRTNKLQEKYPPATMAALMAMTIAATTGLLGINQFIHYQGLSN